MAGLGSTGLSAARKMELWERWKAGKSARDIAREVYRVLASLSLNKPSVSVS